MKPNKRGKYKKRSLKDRIMPKVKIPKNGCWVWMGATRNKQGTIKINGKPETVKRVIWEICQGKLPKEIVLVNSCRNRLCINPDHMVFCGNEEKIDEFVENKNAIPVPISEVAINPEAIRELRGNLRLWAWVSEGKPERLPASIAKILKELWAICDNGNTDIHHVNFKDYEQIRVGK